MRIVAILALFAVVPAAAQTPPVLFDGHIHYSDNVWGRLSPARAIILLTEAGIERCLVSSTPNAGTERLYHEAPGRVVPFLRPYRNHDDMETWFNDPASVGFVRKRLGRIPYRGIGEFHVPGAGTRTPVFARIVDLARERGLALHAHTDEQGIRHILELAPDVVVIWAHTGFDVPIASLRKLLAAHANLYLELSFRAGITRDGRLTEDWRRLFGDYPRRFLTGMDTYIPARWVMLDRYADDARNWLGQLPPDVAESIARGNARRLFP